MKTARVRIGKVTHKGSNLAVLRNAKSEDHGVIIHHVSQAIDAMKNCDVAGMAFILWDIEGTSVVKQLVKDGSRIPCILVPDFVRNRLLADRIEEWTIEIINQSRR